MSTKINLSRWIDPDAPIDTRWDIGCLVISAIAAVAVAFFIA